MRQAEIKRETKETQIQLSVNLDGTGEAAIETGCGFLNHMLELFARHGDFDLKITCHGDTQVDDHHSAEDIGICLGKAFEQALGDKRGITRYGQFLLPMDETLVLCACDLSGRDYLGWTVELPAAKVGNFDTELAKEFWLGFVRNCPGSIHIRQMAGENTHHILEAIFKGMGRTLKAAVSLDAKHLNEIPSTKGLL
ncbi:MAG: imidazoleglycerol-phosphate dehydratase HisB [Oscillibacter sp.]|jgi:imidazoleglycerol-phosphate dehydratase|nr:imidazoleglycerol-phosphate dehydratase HisB [Oscillibacter sp.]MCI8689810.1 imidazoleglycerol-phosphate dehydratase HisB [Oscillibacter sp.]MCI8848039.1 imidazoleglycerol-phosphate dehydratase HisB [Oscillibacter sp.]MCI9375692.1 imidazoleglycerol-phosphate dehydratase HisB [Oscillibacter sp.]MCI9481979.1 imidazoleglycerol-phosphate dehydratase HisB [Oscillibacter sp.]